MLEGERIIVIAKPTHECNFKCKYCYIPSETIEKGHMNDETLRSLTEGLFSNFDKIKIIWHGGEPTLMGLDFYEKVKDIQAEYDSKRFSNRIQTNAGKTLTEELIDFFKSEKINISFSLDGPKHLHNLTRVYHNNKGTFDDVIRSVNLMKRKEMRTGAICILNRYNIDNTDEIYNFFKKRQINLKVNPLIQIGRAKNNANLSITPQEYANAMTRFFDRWLFDKDPKIMVDPFQGDIKGFLSNTPYGCNSSGDCAERFLGIDPSGDVYPCGRFSGEEEFRYGNVNKTPLKKILESEKRKKLIKRKEIMTGIGGECNPCNWRDLCNSGCMHNAYINNGTVYSRDLYCESTKILYNHIAKTIDSQLMLASLNI